MKNPFEKSNRKEEYNELSHQIESGDIDISSLDKLRHFLGNNDLGPYRPYWDIKNRVKDRLRKIRDELKEEDHDEAIGLDKKFADLQKEIEDSLDYMHHYEKANPGIKDDELHKRVQRANQAFENLEEFRKAT